MLPEVRLRTSGSTKVRWRVHWRDALGARIVTLVARMFLSSRFLSRFGLGAGLAATPALMMAGSVSLITVSLALPHLRLFWLVVFLKIAEGTARNSLSKPA